MKRMEKRKTILLCLRTLFQVGEGEERSTNAEKDRNKTNNDGKHNKERDELPVHLVVSIFRMSIPQT